MAVASASGVFSGLMAAAIAKMGGLGGYESWRWIFLIEGGVTILLGFLTFFFLVDTPKQSTKWLEPDEIRYLEILSFIKEGGRSTRSKGPSKWQDFLSIIKDWRYWAFGILFHNVGTCGYGKTSRNATLTTDTDLYRSQICRSVHHKRPWIH